MSESVFLSPKSIAVVGASDKQGSVGRAITSNIMNGYKGTVYPISPTREIANAVGNTIPKVSKLKGILPSEIEPNGIVN